jgi:hypothetical protein
MRTAAVLMCTLALAATAQTRHLTFNGRPLTPEQMQRLEKVERMYGVRLPDQKFWYDNRSGTAGFWNGPGVAALPPGLDLGGPMPPNCSGGGTGVFINGRELHPIDVAILSQLGPVLRGRYWLEANGYFGVEGGPALGNLFALANAAAPRSQGQHRVYAPGELSGLIGNPEVGYCTQAGNCAYRR